MESLEKGRKSPSTGSPAEEMIINAQTSTQAGVVAGMKAASVACVASSIPTLVACRRIPWAKANLNHTAQALIICTASIASYFIAADKTILDSARRQADYDRTLNMRKE